MSQRNPNMLVIGHFWTIRHNRMARLIMRDAIRMERLRRARHPVTEHQGWCRVEGLEVET